ncbi:hypothetical protein E1211_17935 [Micromonospora sp. 15K316]|uniref:hypothetical protein n=1 Tax=Micromonospora sp. 15K316 TaxID=2530376 RepID=UPI001049DBA9|nr:hypothetical protein [Micromonospora sp. 15K316]TDC34227.1 hypothetical protein E1211_17935 [Micromonospora sp. 15K316]
MTATPTHDPDVLAQVVADRPVADYTPTTARDARSCDGHSTRNQVGYVVRRTIGDNGQRLTDPATPDRLGVDVYAVACQPGWGNYDKALAAARPYRSMRQGGSWAVIDTLYGCGHRGQA